MKVLIVSKFLYMRGGAEVYAINLGHLLKKYGHEVQFYSMQYPQNIAVKESHYFADEVSFFDTRLSCKLKALLRILGDGIRESFEKILNDFKPDIVHLNNIHSYLSPIVARIAFEKKIPAIWTVHDYKLVCPAYSCLHNGKPCELCLKSPFYVLTKKCMKNSFLQSACAYIEALYWNKNKVQKYTNCFIAPSSFLKQMIIKGGFNESKIETILHCIPREISPNDALQEKSDYYCYVGRISEEKGIITLLEAAKKMPYKLIMVGDGPLRSELSKKFNEVDNISFVGFKQWDELKSIIGKARFLVSPSKCYEVFGLVNVEAQALGTPVLGANIGGIPETICLGISGDLFEPDNIVDLQNKITQMFQAQFDYDEISKNARELFSMEHYYNKIMNLYNRILKL